MVEQTTTYPVTDTTTLRVSGSGTWTLRVRIPSWTSGAVVTVNGVRTGPTPVPGTYASISKSWQTGDVVSVKLPTSFRLIPANDNAALAAVAYGPVVLTGNYGSSSLSSAPTLVLSSLKRTGPLALTFSGIADGKSVQLSPFYDAQDFNYVVYWGMSGSLPKH